MRPLVLGLALILAAPIAASAVGITLNPPGSGGSQVVVSATGTGEDSVFPAALPAGGSLHASLGGNSADTTYDLSSAGFIITFAHANDGAVGSGAVSTAFLWFTPDEDVGYSLTGAYTSIDPDGQFIEFTAQLFDFSGGPVSFLFDEIRDGVPDASFAIGTQQGATGTLSAGHLYNFAYGAFDGNTNSPGSLRPASSNGFVRLMFVPEPDAALLLALGLVGLARWWGAEMRRAPRSC